MAARTLRPEFVVDGVTYLERPVTEVETALGVTHVFSWVDLNAGRGFTVVRQIGRPKMCTCPTMLCQHRTAIADQLRERTPEPVA